MLPALTRNRIRGLDQDITGIGTPRADELVRTYVGVVCEVEVDRDIGEIAVKRFFVAQNCGQIINPDGLRNRIESNVVQTVSRVLKEEVLFSQSKVTSVMDLIDRPDQVPWGAGEPTAAMVPAAIGNAVFDAIGVQIAVTVPDDMPLLWLRRGTSGADGYQVRQPIANFRAQESACSLCLYEKSDGLARHSPTGRPAEYS